MDEDDIKFRVRCCRNICADKDVSTVIGDNTDAYNTNLLFIFSKCTDSESCYTHIQLDQYYSECNRFFHNNLKPLLLYVYINSSVTLIYVN